MRKLAPMAVSLGLIVLTGGCATFESISTGVVQQPTLRDQMMAGYTQRITITEVDLLNYTKASTVQGSGFEEQDRYLNWLEGFFKKDSSESMFYLHQEIQYNGEEWRTFYTALWPSDAGIVRKGLTTTQRRQSNCQPGKGPLQSQCDFKETVVFGVTRQELLRMIDKSRSVNEQFIEIEYLAVTGDRHISTFPVLEAESLIDQR